MIKYFKILNKYADSPRFVQDSKGSTLNRSGSGYIKRRLGLLSNEINELLESQREINAVKKR